MKKIFLNVTMFLLFSWVAVAQPKEVKLVVSGEGATKEEATVNALRSAVEQAFGAFISADTRILNDEIVHDEIATVTSGNIKSFEECSYIESQNGVKYIILDVIVSLGQLIQYAKNHGSAIEFAGNTFGANLRMYEMNVQMAQKAIRQLFCELVRLVPAMYDYRVKVENPIVDGDVVACNAVIEVVANENTSKIGEYYLNTLQALSNSEEEIKPFIDMGEEYVAYFSVSLDETMKMNEYKRQFLFEIPGGSGELYVVKVHQPPFVSGEGTYFLPKRYFPFPLNQAEWNILFQCGVEGYKIISNNGEELEFMLSAKYDYHKGECHFEKGSLYGGYKNYLTFPITAHTGIFDLKRLGCNGVIATNTSYPPSEVIYSIPGTLKIPKTKLSQISRIEVTTTDFLGALLKVKPEFVMPLYEMGAISESDIKQYQDNEHIAHLIKFGNLPNL